MRRPDDSPREGPARSEGIAPVGRGSGWGAAGRSQLRLTAFHGSGAPRTTWQSRGWFLGEHHKQLFDNTGNAGPTVWWDGRVVGGWTQRSGGEIVLRLLEDVGADAASRIDAEAARLQDWIGPVRVTPRFRTPLERMLGS